MAMSDFTLSSVVVEKSPLFPLPDYLSGSVTSQLSSSLHLPVVHRRRRSFIWSSDLKVESRSHFNPNSRISEGESRRSTRSSAHTCTGSAANDIRTEAHLRVWNTWNSQLRMTNASAFHLTIRTLARRCVLPHLTSPHFASSSHLLNSSTSPTVSPQAASFLFAIRTVLRHHLSGVVIIFDDIRRDGCTCT
ncbi:hypothetical protein SCHPADRAFT_617116 [Schizopora paradoxa]|uniref:Uncharacterized protein n=1 Tax=Schizopora paradoxa TaxID=27342 RepID=A0A0H2R8P6_9AGAM|nr:hypothetical protein SCHPADRAFT_617116 [Schizopora paradoxa]